MGAFTDAEIGYLSDHHVARLASASPAGQPDVSPVGFELDGDDIVSGGLDLTKTIRYRHLIANQQAAVVIDDLDDHGVPRGVKVRGPATVEQVGETVRIRVRPETIWSWGINQGAETYFAGSVEKRHVPSPPGPLP